MTEGNLTTNDHDILIEMRTELGYIRAELTKLNGMVTDIIRALTPMPERIEHGQ